MYFRFIQAIFLCIVLIGWVAYQILIRKKPVAQINDDVMMIAFFIAVWTGIVLWLVY
ncbi:hypothetical protein [Niastella caeni]|uniref:hypothetical protein n=1 Tax=Niastella caeni TaxID=2569763 RepID=UPI00129B0EF8|nr:hypothetical protein [Niastella caeni]